LKHLLIAALILSLTACGAKPPPPPPVLTLNIIGSAGQNPDATGHGAPVAVQLYQLASTGKFQSADVYSLMGSEAATLGTDEMGPSTQYLLAPGAKLSETIALKPTVTNIGITVLFAQINKSTWKLTAPVAANGPSVVTVQITGLTATLK
jgi:type VI secretion system protein VasD